MIYLPKIHLGETLGFLASFWPTINPAPTARLDICEKNEPNTFVRALSH